MEGNQSLSLRGGWFTALLALCVVMFAGRTSAQQPTPTLPPSGILAQSYTGSVDAVSPLQTIAGPATVAHTSYDFDSCVPATTCPVEMGLCDTITESLFGDASAAGKWRPLTLDTFFSEGWHEPWAGGPAGQSGLTPRHGWLGAFEGVFYRLWLVNGTYQNSLNKPFGGNGYRGDFTTFLPFSRRFELFVSVPFVAANGTEDPTRGYESDVGDISLAGSFLLSETEACTQLFTLGAIVPTGQSGTGGDLTAVNPRYSFWSNPGGAWVVRGGTGVTIPLNEPTAQTTFAGDIAIGRYFRPHDVPFGDLVFYVNSNVLVPLENGGPTNVGVGPGTRFQITGDWYLLSYLEMQLGSDSPYDYQVQAAIVKAW